jgi:hypothetical protein
LYNLEAQCIYHGDDIMASNKLNGADYLLLLLYVDNKKPIKGAVRLMKMMFLFEKEIAPILKSKGLNPENLPEFFPFDFGAFSKDVYEQVELFKNIDFIKVRNLYGAEEMAEVDDLEDEPFINEEYQRDSKVRQLDGKYYEYRIVKNGVGFIEQEIIGKNLITEVQLNVLAQFKVRINTLSPKQILRYTYTKYPEYTANSLIKDEVLGNG